MVILHLSAVAINNNNYHEFINEENSGYYPGVE